MYKVYSNVKYVLYNKLAEKISVAKLFLLEPTQIKQYFCKTYGNPSTFSINFSAPYKTQVVSCGGKTVVALAMWQQLPFVACLPF